MSTQPVRKPLVSSPQPQKAVLAVVNDASVAVDSPALAAVNDASVAVDSPARLRHLQLSAALDQAEPHVEMMSPLARAAILVGGAVAAWACVIGLVVAVA